MSILFHTDEGFTIGIVDVVKALVSLHIRNAVVLHDNLNARIVFNRRMEIVVVFEGYLTLTPD